MCRVILLLGLIVVLNSADCQKYTDRYDDINVDEVLANRRLLIGYVKCVLDQGRCTPEGKELKLHIADGMQTACTKCTERQKYIARTVVKYVRDNEKDYWQQITAKFDPKDEYKPIYESFLAGESS